MSVLRQVSRDFEAATHEIGHFLCALSLGVGVLEVNIDSDELAEGGFILYDQAPSKRVDGLIAYAADAFLLSLNIDPGRGGRKDLKRFEASRLPQTWTATALAALFSTRGVAELGQGLARFLVKHRTLRAEDCARIAEQHGPTLRAGGRALLAALDPASRKLIEDELAARAD